MKFSKSYRVYISNSLTENDFLNLVDNNFHYIKTVLRLKVKDKFRIFNERDGEFIAQITDVTRNNLLIQIVKLLRKPSYSNSLTLAIAIIKPERLMQAVNMAVQLGVTNIVPLITDRSQFKEINHTRLFKCIIEATEQSERIIPPSLEPILTLEAYLKKNSNTLILYANEQQDVATSLLKILPLPKDIIYIVGPEGGFSDAELSLFSNIKNTKSFSLGRNILRTETAAAAGLAQINLLVYNTIDDD